ncbi:hypothetical protein D3C71_880720 [compost metagenome]
MPIEEDIKQRRKQHAACCCRAGEDASAPGGKLTVQHLALDLKPNEQKEDGHQRVIDPVLQAERPDINVQCVEIILSKRRVRRNDRQGGDDHEYNTARCLVVEKVAEG